VTDDECARVVNLLISTWPTGVRGYVWTDALGSLRYDMALATYRTLRDSERTCTVAHFQHAYRQRVDAARRSAQAQPELPIHEEALAPDHPRAMRAFERGLIQGKAERAREVAQIEERERLAALAREERLARKVAT